MKKLVAILMVLLLVLTSTAMAEMVSRSDTQSYTITINNSAEGYTYAAYQIFKGDLNGKVLSNIEWGDNVTPSVTLNGVTYTDAAALSAVLNDGNVDALAAAVNLTTAKAESTFVAAEGKYVIDNLPAGYYLVKNTVVPEGGAHTKFIVCVVANAAASPKTDSTTHMKKVNENVKAATAPNTGAYGSNYNDVADYSIGDEVPFAIHSKVPDMSHFATYTMVFEDDMSDGLTFIPGSLKVSVGGTEISKDAYTVVNGSSDADDFTLTITDLKKVASATTGAAIRIDFKAELNKSAKIGLPGNPNKSRLSFSNNPNVSTSTTTTPWDEVVVFTYELDVTKLDGSTQKPLADAEFVFYRNVGGAPEYVITDASGVVTGWTAAQVNATTFTTGESGLIKIVGLDDGSYYLRETKAPKGYNTLKADIECVVKATTKNDQNYAGSAPDTALTALKLNVGGATVDSDKNYGVVKTDVLNYIGATLPETGGIGTTLFYLLGGAMVAISALVLIIRRRAQADQE